MLDDNTLKTILSNVKNIAVIGLSENPDKPSYQVASYLKKHGYTIIPINPKYSVILGEKAYADITSAASELGQKAIEIIDIFRRSEDVLPHVREAITLKPKLIWMQEGVEHLEGARMAENSGIDVVMNACLKKAHQRLFGGN